GKRLESRDGPARIYVCRRGRSCAAVWEIDGRSALRANRLDKRHIHRQRNTPSGEKYCACIGDWLRQCGDSFCTCESCVRGSVTVLRNSACAAKPRSGGDDERHLRSPRWIMHGGSDHDFYLWL